MNYQWNGQQVLDQVHQRIVTQMNELGRGVVSVAKERAPFRTGHLRNSIYYKWDDKTYTVAFVVDAEYGIFVEYGTRYMKPHPYLRPALAMAGNIYGINLAMAFTQTPYIASPILAHGTGFHLPSTLTPKQIEHVRTHLKPKSVQYAERGNVSRTRLWVKQGQQPIPGMGLPRHYRRGHRR